MNELEKRYRIEELEAYSEEWKSNKAYNDEWFKIGGLGLFLSVIGAKGLSEADMRFFGTGALFAGGVIGLKAIGKLLESIKEKTEIEEKIDEINALIDGYDENKTRGGR